MVTQRQRQAAKRNIRKAIGAAKSRKSIAHMPAKTRTALGKQAAAVARRRRTGASEPKTISMASSNLKRASISGTSGTYVSY